MTWRAFLEKMPWSGVENLRIARMEVDGIDVVQPLVLKRYRRNEGIPRDEMALSAGTFAAENDIRGFLQAIVDLAWAEGIRPAAIEDQRNELKAVRDHLADMRTLAFKASEIKQ